jgi:hypothetical protein
VLVVGVTDGSADRDDVCDGDAVEVRDAVRVADDVRVPDGDCEPDDVADDDDVADADDVTEGDAVDDAVDDEVWSGVPLGDCGGFSDALGVGVRVEHADDDGPSGGLITAV